MRKIAAFNQNLDFSLSKCYNKNIIIRIENFKVILRKRENDMKKALKAVIRAAWIIALTLLLYSCGEGETPTGQETTTGQGMTTGQNPECQHVEVRVATEREISATCTEGGEYDAVRYCSACDKEMSRDRISTSPLGHDEVSHSGKAPTCEEAGYGDYVSCSRCTYTTYEIIPATDHQKVHHEAKSSTCTEAGWHAYETCTACEYTTYQELPALQHDIVTALAQEPNCTNVGWGDYEYCSRCEYTTYEEIPALNHKTVDNLAQEPTCTDFGWYAYQTCERCDWDNKFENLIDPLDHDKVYYDAKSETCTEDGWYAYEACTRCSYSTKQDNIIEKRHLMETDWGKKETCTEIGWDIYYYCTRCSYKENYNEIPALEHDIVTMPGKTPTCTEGGWREFRYCSRGDWSEELENKLDALDHDIIEHQAKDPTCYEDGCYAYQTCSRCDDFNTFKANPSNGHSYVILNDPPTCTEPGSKTTTCANCNDVDLHEELAPYGHDDVPMLRIEPTCTTVGYETIAYCRRCYVIEHTPEIAPKPVLLNTTPHNYVNGECTVCHNREGSVGLEFELASDGKSYELVGLGTCTDKVIIIPSTYNNLPVSRIKQAALAYSDIVSLYIPSTLDPMIISIDNSVFLDCFNLVEIINNSEIDTEDFNFFIKDQLLGDHNGNSNMVLLDGYYFYVENGEATLVSYVGDGTEITLPDSFNGENYKIHMNAFRASGIESIVIPKTVSEIGDWALYTKNSVKCVTINFLGTKAEWETIKLSADAKQWINTIVYHYGSAHTITTYAAKEATCTEAGYSAYEECSVCDYKSERVEYEPTGHFYEYTVCRFCGEEIVYSVGLDFELSADGNYYIVTGIGTCTDDYIIVPAYIDSKPVQEIGEDAFANKEILGVHLPVTVTHIGGSAFSGCYMLKYVSLGYEVETIDYYAFAWCNSLVAIKIGSSYLKTINSSAFMDCNALTDVYYAADAEKWNEIEINPNDNDCLTNADIHYNWVAK